MAKRKASDTQTAEADEPAANEVSDPGRTEAGVWLQRDEADELPPTRCLTPRPKPRHARRARARARRVPRPRAAHARGARELPQALGPRVHRTPSAAGAPTSRAAWCRRSTTWSARFRRPASNLDPPDAHRASLPARPRSPRAARSRHTRRSRPAWRSSTARSSARFARPASSRSTPPARSSTPTATRRSRRGPRSTARRPASSPRRSSAATSLGDVLIRPARVVVTS